MLIEAFSLVACGVYYYVWVNLLPKIKGYQLRQTVIELDEGSVAHELVRVKEADVAAWDAEHDVTGRLIHRRVHVGNEQGEKGTEVQKS